MSERDPSQRHPVVDFLMFMAKILAGIIGLIAGQLVMSHFFK